MAPTLYHVPRTISSPIFQALLELNLVDKSVVVVETLTFAELKSPEHLARNPMGTSPAFTDEENEIAIWESGAVMTYLLEAYDDKFQLHPEPGRAPPAERAKFLHLQQYIIATVYPFLATLFIHMLKQKEEQDLKYVDEAKSKWRTLLAPTLMKFLGDSPYFMGEKLSAIDLLVAKPLNNASSLGILSDFPELEAVFQRVKCLKSFAIAYGAEQSESPSQKLVLVPASD